MILRNSPTRTAARYKARLGNDGNMDAKLLKQFRCLVPAGTWLKPGVNEAGTAERREFYGFLKYSSGRFKMRRLWCEGVGRRLARSLRAAQKAFMATVEIIGCCSA